MQNIIVILIGIIVFGYVSWKIFKTITRKPGDKCSGCSGCALKIDMDCTPKKKSSDRSESPLRSDLKS